MSRKQYNSMAHSLYNMLKKEGASERDFGKGSIKNIEKALEKGDRRITQKNIHLEEIGEEVYDTTSSELYYLYKNGYLTKRDYLDGIKEQLLNSEEYKMEIGLETRMGGFLEKYGELPYTFDGKTQSIREWTEDLDTGAISRYKYYDLIEDFKHSDLYDKSNYERNRLQ